MSILLLGITIYVAYRLGDRTYDYAVRAMEDGDVTEYLAIPRWPVVGFITLSIFLAAVMAGLRMLTIFATPGRVPEEDQQGEGT